jgi:hypothetical protein
MLNGKVGFSSLVVGKEWGGFLKMNKDPKGECLTQQNLIFRDSILKYSEWAYGMVINVGKDCMIYQFNPGFKMLAKSFFQKKSNHYFILAYLHVWINVLVINYLNFYKI